MASVKVPELEKKLDLLFAHTGLDRNQILARLKRAGSTFSGWLNGTETTAPEMVPEHGRRHLAELLSEAVGGRISVAEARARWLGPLEAFAAVFHTPALGVFLEMLGRAQRAEILTYRRGGRDDVRLVQFFDAAAGDPGIIRAKLGETFSFDVLGPPGALIVLIVQTEVGSHLGAPGPNAPMRIPEEGCVRLPLEPEFYNFKAPGGLHCFLAFAVTTKTPLSIYARAGSTLPLASEDLETFGKEMLTQTNSWVLDTVRVVVED